MKKQTNVIARLTKSAEAILASALLILLLSSVSIAEIPHYMQFQGKATDADDTPLNGSYKITFRIYDAETGGELLWNETHNVVEVENGVFSVLLGGVTALDLSFDKPYWISIEIDTSDGTNEMDRQLITSVAYAYRAMTAYSAETAATADNSGKIVQLVNTETGEYSTHAAWIPWDDTIPQNTEGGEYMSLAIMPKSTANKLKIDVVVNGISKNYTSHCVALFQDNVPNAIACAHSYPYSQIANISFTHYMTAETTSETTFKVRIGTGDGAAYYFNGFSSGRLYGGVQASSITITEIAL